MPDTRAADTPWRASSITFRYGDMTRVSSNSYNIVIVSNVK